MLCYTKKDKEKINMASLMIHLLIGEQYCKKNNIIDKENFINGNLSPDKANDKKISHYSFDVQPKNYTEILKYKVNLVDFCQKNNLVDDYTKGIFLHLITDFLFYNKYLIEIEYFKKQLNSPAKHLNSIIYDEYGRVSHWLMVNYKDYINLDLLTPMGKTCINEPVTFFKTSNLIEFMEYCSNIDLIESYNRILQQRTNDIFDYKYISK